MLDLFGCPPAHFLQHLRESAEERQQGEGGRCVSRAVSMLCEDHSVCANSVEMLAENTLELPKITTEDRCYSSGFRKEKCLQKIHNDLLKYKIYLVHVKETFTSDKNIVEAIEYKTSILAETVQKMMKRSKIESNENKTQNTTQITQVLKSENIWIQKVTNRLILQGFIDFIQKTARVIRFIGTFHGGKKD
ncbi:hypothetical protein GDO86_011736 [Hymenochirus boettgeri]|uniref:Interleukin-6 n=1 Tax=Hymenochirus boettgeri TaxID=247094 RepID=A0A8T2JI74_9PIPI|nr:hypothetical protein GDO86_011736 [Hymenochirus boettgeri]